MLIWYAWPQAIVHKGSTITHFEEEPIKVPSDNGLVSLLKQNGFDVEPTTVPGD